MYFKPELTNIIIEIFKKNIWQLYFEWFIFKIKRKEN
jgi:hypothetical protein